MGGSQGTRGSSRLEGHILRDGQGKDWAKGFTAAHPGVNRILLAYSVPCGVGTNLLWDLVFRMARSSLVTQRGQNREKKTGEENTSELNFYTSRAKKVENTSHVCDIAGPQHISHKNKGLSTSGLKGIQK